MNKKTRSICYGAIITALYVITTIINPLGYGFIQLRLSEIIAVLPFWDSRLRVPCLVGIAVANMFSPLGIIDVIIGVAIGCIAYWVITLVENMYLRCALYSVLCGVLVGAELSIVFNTPYLINLMSITLSQLVVMAIAVVVNNKVYKIINTKKVHIVSQ